MSIFPLPVFEADADSSNRDALTLEEQLEQLTPPETLVVRFGSMGMIGEYKQAGGIRAGCGSKLVARTHRGTEVVDMLTTTCSNSGCSKSISRKEMLDFIDRSGGKHYPFNTNGRVLRIATADDLSRDMQLKSNTKEYAKVAKQLVEEHRLAMEIVDVEPILGEELLTFYFLSEDRVDFRPLVYDLAAKYSTRIEMRQVGARDEARLVADYERCGQHCCCKNFLKVLSPVSMRSAKQQKQSLDPRKISGRCGRLMCCLRYEDETYRDLKKNLPHKKTRVGTPEGPGIVLDGQILTQLVLVELEHDSRQVAIPLEELSDPEECPQPGEEFNKDKELPSQSGSRRGKRARGKSRTIEGVDEAPRKKRRRGRRRSRRKGSHDTDNN
ncbi:MAG: regulatory iron-sulfur-containing complex subunit RicT [Planctomycetota bacterium]|nr:regulatory iron-sulfur-containing complex subunit RicT [Planctomycetota bacterium]